MRRVTDFSNLKPGNNALQPKQRKLTSVRAGSSFAAMNTLDSKALKIFISVVRHGSIRGAAEHLAVAPSVVSRQIAETERNVGQPLFDRTSRGVGLTDAGHLVFEHAKRVVEDSDLLAEQLAQLRGVQQGRIRICCGEGFLADLVENGLRSFAAVYPTLRFVIQRGNTEEVMDATANGDADMGIAYSPVVDTRLRAIAIARQPLCVVLPAGHPLKERERVSLAECLALPCGILSKGHGVTQLIGRVAADQGIALAPVVETVSIDALRRFVAVGLGVTFLPRAAVSTESALDTVELSDPLLQEASTHLLVRARRRLPVSVERLANWLAANMAAFRN